MADHLFLCGLTEAQRADYGPGRELYLHGPKSNVRLRLDDVRSQLLNVESEDLLTDLAEIAVYVFAADCAVPRGGPTFKNVGANWRRTFKLVIAVRHPVMWREPQRLTGLRDVVQFLSDDAWHFEFVDLLNPPAIQDYLQLANTDVERSGDSTVMLFSGGLDSFAGAVHELNTSNRHVVLVSRRLGGITDKYQRDLAADLKKRYPRRVTHVGVNAGLTKETEADEHTQRTRSFLFAAIAIIAAAIECSNRVRFYENGIMSVNLPIATEVVGTRSSRSTHPRSLLLLNQLVRQVGGGDIEIDNPFIWKTKVEVVQELLKRSDRDSIRYTLSCSHTRDVDHYATHCGRCAQCIQRRISTLGAGAAELDPSSAYEVDLLRGPRQDGEDRQMAIGMINAAVEFRQLSEVGFATRFASEFGWLTTSFPGFSPGEVARNFIGMFKRHGDSVREIFVSATRENAEDLFDKSLPESSLLRTWYESALPELHEEPLADAQPQAIDAVGEEDDDSYELESPVVVLALDERRQQVLIDGIAPIRGPTNFRIISVLAQLHREDREAERLPEHFRTISSDDLAEKASSSGDIAGRRAIARLRRHISKEFAKLYPAGIQRNAVVENVPRKGYRLNPHVRIVSANELARR